MAPDLGQRDVHPFSTGVNVDTPADAILSLAPAGTDFAITTIVATVPPAADLEPSATWFVLKYLLGYPSVK